MSIGEQLKKLREQNGLTRKEASEKLKEIGIDISDKTLYGYESNRNSANADMFLALCKIYKCTNVMEVFSDSVDDILFTNEEWELIEDYRKLDRHGKVMVDTVLEMESARVLEEKVSKDIDELLKDESIYRQKMAERMAIKKPTSILSNPAADYLLPDAAHEIPGSTPEQRAIGDALMDDDEFWK